jgi:hypothetical protein
MFDCRMWRNVEVLDRLTTNRMEPVTWQLCWEVGRYVGDGKIRWWWELGFARGAASLQRQ